MQQSTNRYKKFLPQSLVLHVIVLVVLFGSISFTAGVMTSASAEKTEIVDATVLDQSQVAAQVKAIQKAEAKARQKQLDDAWRLHVKSKKLKKEITAQENKLAKMKADIEATKKKQADLKKKRLADEKAKKAAAAKKAKEKKLAEAKKVEEQKKLAAAKKKAAEAEKAAKARAASFASEIEKFKGLILQAISDKWTVPSSARKEMTAKLLIELGPGGAVTNVQVLKTSSNDALDRSAVAAVYKASPLPVPKDKEALDQFRSFSLTVTPKDVG